MAQSSTAQETTGTVAQFAAEALFALTVWKRRCASSHGNMVNPVILGSWNTCISWSVISFYKSTWQENPTLAGSAESMLVDDVEEWKTSNKSKSFQEYWEA